MGARRLAASLLVLVASGLAGLIGSAAVRGGGPPAGDPAPPLAVHGGTGFSAAAAQAGLSRGRSVVATARARSIRVHGRHARTLRARRFGGQVLPLVFLVKRRRGAWLQVELPTRPNLSTGWLRAADVRLSTTPYAIRVGLKEHRLTLLRRGRVVLRARIAKGRAVSPTPTGRYYITDLVRPPDPRGFFGPYALGLSAHSNVYTRFEGGDGQIGLHGTNTPAVLGRDVSHGCIRVANRVIARLAQHVPLGTPVDITR